MKYFNTTTFHLLGKFESPIEKMFNQNDISFNVEYKFEKLSGNPIIMYFIVDIKTTKFH